MSELLWRRRLERTLTFVRLGGLVVACVDAGYLTEYPRRSYEVAGFVVAASATAGTILLGLVARRPFTLAQQRRFGHVAFALDVAIVGAMVVIYQFEPGAPIRQLLVFIVAEGAVRYAMRGAVVASVVATAILVLGEAFRADKDFGNPEFVADHVVFAALVLSLTALILGFLVRSLRQESERGNERAAEAEALRDQIGRRADVLDATNRCARALASSLDLEQAFAEFARELGGLLPFHRVALILAQERGDARVLAVAGVDADTILPQGSAVPVTPLVQRVLDGETVYRPDLGDARFAEEGALIRAGSRSRVLAPLTLGPIPIGLLSISRAEPDAFTHEDIELTTLLARVVASAVQNIHAYAAEKATADELRRLSSLRADFVSLVSHELRSPMAAVIGAARTLHERWRELRPDQRESFLTLIADETQRLAELIGDVLDTSRIEAGTFTYSFEQVDLAALAHDAVATIQVAQDDVVLVVQAAKGLPPVRADRTRVRQVLENLLDNAVKYSPEGGVVRVEVDADGDVVNVVVRDSGPGIPPEHHGLIFEKFGRTKIGGAKPGTGLGLFIARSIAEAHGGMLDVASGSGGATFTLRLPVSAPEPSLTS